tara:strand:+ start:634 stop:930 length:297 start_codon:yes stop_codon:yes gene_type:complete
MTVKALKKKNKMTGPFKLRSGNSPLFKNVGSSPVRKDGDTMQDTIDSGSFDQAFASARKAGKKVFTYKGESFTTELAKSAPGGKNSGTPPKLGDGEPS